MLLTTPNVICADETAKSESASGNTSLNESASQLIADCSLLTSAWLLHTLLLNTPSTKVPRLRVGMCVTFSSVIPEGEICGLVL